MTEINQSAIDRPTVRLLLDAKSHRIDPFELDLGKEPEMVISTRL